ncbi:MAG: hypothetical protein WCB67_14340 [Solirubrobacteraceae bacterium]
MKHILSGHDPFASMRAPTGSVLPQEPAHRLLCRALELLGPSELGLRMSETLVTDGSCGGGIRHLHALLADLGERGAVPRSPST